MNHPPLTGSKLIWSTIALALSVFMMVLDSTIANVALPTIAGNLGASSTQGTWVVTSFAVANAISIPLTGFLARRLGEVRVFLWSVGLFILASFLCGIAQSLEMLIAFRVMQGAVSGPIAPLSQSLLMACYPLQKRNMALGLWSMVIVVAPIFGPILGGFISDNWHWSWIFLINVPIGVLVCWICYQILKDRETQVVQVPADKVGLFLLVIGVGALQMMLDQGRELDWFRSPTIIILTVVSVVCLTYLVLWEIDHDNPLIDLSLFADRNFTIATIAISLAFMVYIGTIVLLPLILQMQLGYTAVWAGLAAAPVGIFPVLLLPIVGKYGHRVDMRLLVSISFIVYSVVFFWRSGMTPNIDFAEAWHPQLLQGVGSALFFMPLTAIMLSRIPAHQIASASALSNFIRTLAGAIGTSMVMTLWDRRAAVQHSNLTEHLSQFDVQTVEWLRHLSQSGMSLMQQYTVLEQTVTQQAYMIAAGEVYHLAAVLMLCLIVIVWFAKPPFSTGGGGR